MLSLAEIVQVEVKIISQLPFREARGNEQFAG